MATEASADSPYPPYSAPLLAAAAADAAAPADLRLTIDDRRTAVLRRLTILKDEAVAWVKRCPNPMPGPSEIEIRPVFEMADWQ